MTEWIAEALGQILGDDLAGDLSNYILSIDNLPDFDDYMRTLLDLNNNEQRDVYENIKSVKFSQNRYPSRVQEKPTTSFNVKPRNAVRITNNEKFKTNSSMPTQEPEKKGKSKKKIKIQLNELQEGFLRKGRNPCNCEAKIHSLINNCIECGRIVCEQEGSGPCFFCDSMVCTPEERDILDSDTKQASVLYRTLTERKKSDSWKKAIEMRDKYVKLDRTSNEQTKIIDDDHDYFHSHNTWLSKKEKDSAEKKKKQEHDRKHASKLGSRKFNINVKDKQVTENYTDYVYEEVKEGREESFEEDITVPDINALLDSLKNASIKNNVSDRPGVYDEEETLKAKRDCYIIQDKHYLEMSDLGMCLSMHQPWASLLLAGIKRHEGRTWYTPHRGRLWIASTVQEASAEDIRKCEQFYKQYYKGKILQFPKTYPTGCLLGSVLVQDCLSQEEYREEYPDGESESPFVFVCSDPFMLPIGMPVKGSHKIYKLDSRTHKMAADALIIKRSQY